MCRIPGIASLALLVVAASARATPTFRYTWGPATLSQPNQDWMGPGAYDQTLSVTGVSGTLSSIRVVIADGPANLGAWKQLFPGSPPVAPPRPDCNGGIGFDVSQAVTGATAIPGATLDVRVGSDYLSITDRRVRGTISVNLTVSPPLALDGTTRYAIGTLVHNLANAVPGFVSPTCFGADEPFCFVCLGAAAVIDGISTEMLQESPVVSWQIGANSPNCFALATAARASSWGSLKMRYR
jgi:hypothetical protein